MKRRVVLSFILSLVFLTSCGVPNWFYLPNNNVSIKISQQTTNDADISITSEYNLSIDVFLLYTITDADENTEINKSNILSSLRSNFEREYRINEANSIPISPGNNAITSYSSNNSTFYLYALNKVEGNDNRATFSLTKNNLAKLDFTINFNYEEDNGNRFINATLIDSNDLAIESILLSRIGGNSFSQDSTYNDDNINDSTHVGASDYHLYVLPIIYISSTDLSSSGYPFNNTKLVVSSSYLDFDL